MAATWALLPGAQRSLSSSQAGTETAPATGGDGLDLTQVQALVVWLKAATTFPGGGWMRGYSYHPTDGWKRAPGADRPIPDEAIGLDEFLLETFDVRSSRGRFALVAEGVGVAVVMQMLCTSKQGVHL